MACACRKVCKNCKHWNAPKGQNTGECTKAGQNNFMPKQYTRQGDKVMTQARLRRCPMFQEA